ncbi:MAG: hypothetical protein WBW37_11255 [Methyloceanibacter sp.]
MDAKTVLLTANTETAYAVEDRRPGGGRGTPAPCWDFSKTVYNATCPTLGRWVQTRAQAGNFLSCRFEGSMPEGYFVVRSPTYSVAYFVRGSNPKGKLIKQSGSSR